MRHTMLSALTLSVTLVACGVGEDGLGGQIGDEGRPDGCYEVSTEPADAEALFESFGFTPSELATAWSGDWEGDADGEAIEVSVVLDGSSATRLVREWSDGSGDCDDALQIDGTAVVLLGDGVLDEEIAVSMYLEDALAARGGADLALDELSGTMDPGPEFEGFANTSLSLGLSFSEDTAAARSGQLSLSWSASQDNGDGTGTGMTSPASAYPLTPVE